MKKRIISLFLTLAVAFSIVCPLAFADDSSAHVHNWESTAVPDFSDMVNGIPVSVSVKKCSECKFYKHTYTFFGNSFDFISPVAYTSIVEDLLFDVSSHIINVLGQNATAKKYETGGGSAGTGGAGRRPSGYLDDAGTPTYNASGTLQMLVYPKYYSRIDGTTAFRDSFSYTTDSALVTYSNYTYTVKNLTSKKINSYPIYFSDKYLDYVIDSPPIDGTYYTASGVKYLSTPYTSAYYNDAGSRLSMTTGYSKKLSTSDSDVLVFRCEGSYSYDYGFVVNANSTYSVKFLPLTVYIAISTETVTHQTNITINNNTWNGNIYQDNSTNLTYIYPQYTTVNENNVTVTNISNNPIIYNNETKEYYTYDSVTNNYYYITYVTETPTPTPTPDPGTDPTPTPEPGGDTGDTSSILNVLVEIRDNMIQGFADLKATLVQGWADLSANFTLAIENLNLNITNIFNKKFPDQSTPETAQPSPSPSPSPTPDPGETPAPTPAPTDKPSNGNTNNFWNFVFPGGNDDGTENGHKGILWALISLLIAVVTFVLGLGNAYSYVFPFLPAGLVTTIHICVLVLLLFAIIKFVRSFL